MSNFYVFLIVVILIILVGSLVYYFWKTDHYMDNLQSIRKTYYIAFFFVVGVGLIREDFTIMAWKPLALIGVILVFIDLAVFSTPDIWKIGNTELQQSLYVKNTLKRNKKLIDASANKVEKFTNVVLETAPYLTSRNQPSTWEGYKEELKMYLNLYADSFQLNISFFKFNSTDDNEEFVGNVEGAFRNAEYFFNKRIEGVEWRSELIQKLSKGESVQFMDIDEKDVLPKTRESLRTVFIVMFFGKEYNMLIGINSDFAELNGVDAAHILSLAQIFDWHMA